MIKKVFNSLQPKQYATEDIGYSVSNTPAYTFFNSTISGYADWNRCVPICNFDAGASAAQHLYQRIRPASLKLSFNVFLSPTVTSSIYTAKDLTVHLYVGKFKAAGSYADTGYTGTAIPPQDAVSWLLRDGVTPATFDGSAEGAMAPYNHAVYTPIHHKKFRLFKPSGMTNHAQIPALPPEVIVPTSVEASGYAGGPWRTSVRFSILIPCPRHLWYDPLNAVGTVKGLPRNFAPWWTVCFTDNAQGLPGDASFVGQTIGVQCRAKLVYTNNG